MLDGAQGGFEFRLLGESRRVLASVNACVRSTRFSSRWLEVDQGLVARRDDPVEGIERTSRNWPVGRVAYGLAIPFEGLGRVAPSNGLDLARHRLVDAEDVVGQPVGQEPQQELGVGRASAGLGAWSRSVA